MRYSSATMSRWRRQRLRRVPALALWRVEGAAGYTLLANRQGSHLLTLGYHTWRGATRQTTHLFGRATQHACRCQADRPRV